MFPPRPHRFASPLESLDCVFVFRLELFLLSMAPRSHRPPRFFYMRFHFFLTMATTCTRDQGSFLSVIFLRPSFIYSFRPDDSCTAGITFNFVVFFSFLHSVCPSWIYKVVKRASSDVQSRPD